MVGTSPMHAVLAHLPDSILIEPPLIVRRTAA
jgi:hypothetical protein